MFFNPFILIYSRIILDKSSDELYNWIVKRFQKRKCIHENKSFWRNYAPLISATTSDHNSGKDI